MRNARFRHAVAVLLGYLLAAGGFTWPLATRLTTAIPGDGKDGWQGVWGLWWFATALGRAANPFHTDLLFHPFGADLYLHTLMPFDGLLALPAQLLGGPVLAYNVAVLVSLGASAGGAYWLARDRLAHAGALPAGPRGLVPPVAAGLLFGFSPYMADHLLSHLNLVSAEGLPLAVLALLHAGEDRRAAPPGWQALPWGAIAAGALALLVTALCEWQYVLFLGLWTAGWAAWTVVRGGREPQGRPFRARLAPLAGPALAWAAFLLLAAPLIAGALGELNTLAAPAGGSLAQDTLTYSADPLAYLVPSPFHPWWGAWAADLLRPLPGTLIEKVMFPTYTALALAALGLAAGRRGRWPVGGWAAMAGVFAVLSLGPVLHLGGRALPVPLPAWLLYQLPIANLTRAPGRLVVLVLLALAVLLAFGLAAVLQTGGAARRALAGAALMLLGGELWTAPYRLAPGDLPAATALLAALPAGTAVFDVPVRPYETAYMQAQMVHGHPLIGGYLSRAPAYPLLSGVPVFSELATLQTAADLCAPALDGQGPAIFAYFTTSALVLHKDRLDSRGLAAARALAARAGMGAPVAEDARLVLYRPPPAAPRPWANVDTSTWYDRETDAATGGPLRWMGAAGTIHVWRPVATAATLRLEAAAFPAARRIAVTVDGVPATGVVVGAAQGPLAVALPAAAGHTVVTLRALDPPVAPAAAGAGADPRPLSLALTGCTLDLGR